MDRSPEDPIHAGLLAKLQFDTVLHPSFAANSMKTLYEVLGVDRQASITDIAQRYRHHLNQHVANSHPRAISRKDQRRLQHMREAYLLLTSPSQRRIYDIKLARKERARTRLVERIGIAACVVMLLAGAALIVRGYLQVQEKGPSQVARA